jgi:putative membrane protein
MTGRAAGLASLLAMLGPVPVLAQERTWEWQWSPHPMMFMWGAWGIGMFLMMLLFWGLVIAGLVVGIRALLNVGRGEPGDRALEILRERYARGDIDKQEFEARKRDLGS